MEDAELPGPRAVRAGGRRISYREAGAGPVILALHGIGGGSASWAGQFAGLAGRFRFIAWDAPGYGGSDPLPGEAPTAAAYAGAAAALLDALEIPRVHLLGHSLGGLIAAAFARNHPGRVLSLVLADPAAGYAKAREEVRREMLEGRLEAMAAHGPEGVAERRSREVLSAAAPEWAVRRVRGVFAQVRPDGYAQAARMLHGADIHADAAEVAAPALVMCGSEDTVTPEKICRRVAESLPGAGYRTLEGLGHAGYVEGAEAFNAALAAFVDRAPA